MMDLCTIRATEPALHAQHCSEGLKESHASHTPVAQDPIDPLPSAPLDCPSQPLCTDDQGSCGDTPAAVAPEAVSQSESEMLPKTFVPKRECEPAPVDRAADADAMSLLPVDTIPASAPVVPSEAAAPSEGPQNPARRGRGRPPKTSPRPSPPKPLIAKPQPTAGPRVIYSRAPYSYADMPLERMRAHVVRLAEFVGCRRVCFSTGKRIIYISTDPQQCDYPGVMQMERPYTMAQFLNVLEDRLVGDGADARAAVMSCDAEPLRRFLAFFDGYHFLCYADGAPGKRRRFWHEIVEKRVRTVQ